MAIACKKLVSSGVLKENPIISEVAAVSVGIIQDSIILDLCYEEDFAADVDMNVVGTASGQFVEIQGTAEQGAFNFDQMKQMIELAQKGIRELIEIQKNVLARV